MQKSSFHPADTNHTLIFGKDGGGEKMDGKFGVCLFGAFQCPSFLELSSSRLTYCFSFKPVAFQNHGEIHNEDNESENEKDFFPVMRLTT